MSAQNQTIAKIAIFQKKEIRKILHKDEWWFSVIDVIEALSNTDRPRKYWGDLKKKLAKEGFLEVSEKIGQLKILAPDGKMRETYCATTETMFRIIQAIPSPKAEPFRRWLARVGFERIEEIENPELATKIKQTLINKINSSLWWHVLPSDPEAYKKRGKFLASTFNQAAFYGRPNDEPERVDISNPLWGISEKDILKVLFPDNYDELYESVKNVDEAGWYKKRTGLDSKMYKIAKKMGYDAIVLLASNAMKDLVSNRKPRSIELNLCF